MPGPIIKDTASPIDPLWLVAVFSSVSVMVSRTRPLTGALADASLCPTKARITKELKIVNIIKDF